MLEIKIEEVMSFYERYKKELTHKKYNNFLHEVDYLVSIGISRDVAIEMVTDALKNSDVYSGVGLDLKKKIKKIKKILKQADWRLNYVNIDSREYEEIKS